SHPRRTASRARALPCVDGVARWTGCRGRWTCVGNVKCYATSVLQMSAEPPKYRPLERFWPYAELPEQPSDEELASLDPDLYEALFGTRPRPFSITIVFPDLD